MSSIEYIARAVIEENLVAPSGPARYDSEESKILLCRTKGAEHWFFPGGHIEEGESAHGALVREITEELGEESEVLRFICASENKYQTKDGDVHEINLFFEVKFLSDGERVSQEDHLEFAWFTHKELRGATVFPLALRDAILAHHTKDKPFWVSEGF